MIDEQRGLAGIIEQQRRQYDHIPGGKNRLAAQVSQVGVERLAAGNREKDAAENGQAGPPLVRQEADRVAWINRHHHAWMVHDTRRRPRGDDDEPDQHHRSGNLTDARGAAALNGEQAEQDRDRDGHEVGSLNVPVASLRPSSALSTEMAGVMMPSP